MIVGLIYTPIFVIQFMNLLALPDHLHTISLSMCLINSQTFSNSVTGVHINSNTNICICCTTCCVCDIQVSCSVMQQRLIID
jgi:hypothetical protein